MTEESPHPYNLDAEIAVLGALMQDPDTACMAVDSVGLRASDFYADRHALTYEVIRYLAERGTVDELAVVNELKARRKLTKAGGASYIMDLDCPAVANVKAYADEVVDQAILRSLVTTGEEITRLGVEHPDKVKALVQRSVSLVEIMARNSQRVNGVIGDAASLSEWTVAHIIGQTQTRAKYHYPLPRLQEATGGFGKGQLVSIGAQPGVGKSAFKNQILLALDPSVRVGIVNLEMDREDEQIRLISNLTGIDSRRIWDRERLTDDEKERVIDVADELGKRSYEIHQGSKNIEGIKAIQKRHKYDVLVIDHTHKIEGVEDYKTLVRVSHTLKDIALDEDCAVVSLFQLNKGESPGDIPTIGRVKGGGAIHEDSDHMFFIHRTYNEFGYPTKNAQIICAKQRGGTSGWAIPCVFNESRVAFEQKESS